MAKKQGINFYELGRASGASTPKNQQSGFEAFVSGATKGLEDMLTASKAATAALTAAMPAGVPIDKVPEALRVKATEFLTSNKKAYADATRVVASGINPQSQRYKDAIETINGVSIKFENLSNTLEDIALKRKQALDDPSFSPATLNIDRLTFENLQNGSLYSNMTINEDGTASYTDGNGNLKAWSDFAITKQGFTGQQAYIGALEKLRTYKKNTSGASWSNMEGELQITFDALFQKLGPKGAADYAFADDNFIQTMYPGQDVNDLRKNSATKVADDYKTYVMDQLKIEYDKMDSYRKDIDFTPKGYENQAKKAQEKKKFEKMFTSNQQPPPQDMVRYLNNINQNTRDFAMSGQPGSKQGTLKDSSGKVMPPGIYIKKKIVKTDGTYDYIWEQINSPGAPYTLNWEQASNYLNLDLIALD